MPDRRLDKQGKLKPPFVSRKSRHHLDKIWSNLCRVFKTVNLYIRIVRFVIYFLFICFVCLSVSLFTYLLLVKKSAAVFAR